MRRKKSKMWSYNKETNIFIKKKHLMLIFIFICCLFLKGKSEYIWAGYNYYILPQSASEYIDRTDISNMDKQQLCYARNEIFARHGRRFQSQELTVYFNQMDWYQGNVQPEDFDSEWLNAYEQANVEFIKEMENIGGGPYEVDRPGYVVYWLPQEIEMGYSVNIGDYILIDGENFPDPVFRNYVSRSFDSNGDGSLSETERMAVTHINLDCSEDNYGTLTSLRGVEIFPNLISLMCDYNQVTEIDVSNNYKLQTLTFNHNEVSSINLRNNYELIEFYATDNFLSEVDVSMNPKLQALYCDDNFVQHIDISNNPDLNMDWTDFGNAEVAIEYNSIKNEVLEASEVIDYSIVEDFINNFPEHGRDSFSLPGREEIYTEEEMVLWLQNHGWLEYINLYADAGAPSSENPAWAYTAQNGEWDLSGYSYIEWHEKVDDDYSNGCSVSISTKCPAEDGSMVYERCKEILDEYFYWSYRDVEDDKTLWSGFFDEDSTARVIK